MNTIQLIHASDLGTGLEVNNGKVVLSSMIATDEEVDVAIMQAKASNAEAAKRKRYIQLFKHSLAATGVWEYAGVGQGIKFQGRMLSIGIGEGPESASTGYLNIHTPASGTVVKGLGIPDRAVGANGLIPLNYWDTLLYKLPPAGSHPDVQGEWFVSNYNQGDYEVPEDFIYIGTVNADQYGMFKRFDGVHLQKGITYPDSEWITFAEAKIYASGETDYGNGYQAPRFCRRNNRVYVEGLANGNVTGHIATLPEGFRPKARHIFAMSDHQGITRLDVSANGVIEVVTETAGHAWVPLEFNFDLN